MREVVVTLALVLLTIPALAAETPTMICKNGIVSAGDLMPEVLAKCGEPAMKTQREEIRVEKSREPYGARERTLATAVTIDVWTFNFGRNEFLHVVSFENGRVKRIESAGYGY